MEKLKKGNQGAAKRIAFAMLNKRIKRGKYL